MRIPAKLIPLDKLKRVLLVIVLVVITCEYEQEKDYARIEDGG